MLASSILEPVQQRPLGHSTIRAQIHRHTNLSGATRRACAPRTPFLTRRVRYIPYQPETMHGTSTCAHPHSAPSPIPYFGGGTASWYPPSSATHSSANTPPSPWSQQYNHHLAAEQRGRAEMQQQLVQCQQAMAAMQHQLATMNAASIKKQRQQKQAMRRRLAASALQRRPRIAHITGAHRADRLGGEKGARPAAASQVSRARRRAASRAATSLTAPPIQRACRP